VHICQSGITNNWDENAVSLWTTSPFLGLDVTSAHSALRYVRNSERERAREAETNVSCSRKRRYIVWNFFRDRSEGFIVREVGAPSRVNEILFAGMFKQPRRTNIRANVEINTRLNNGYQRPDRQRDATFMHHRERIARRANKVRSVAKSARLRSNSGFERAITTTARRRVVFEVSSTMRQRNSFNL